MSTDLILQSNQNSVILQELKASGLQDLSYSTKYSYPLISKKQVEIVPRNSIGTGTDLAGTTVIFDITRSQLMRKLAIKTTVLGSTNTNSLTLPLGLNLWSRIEFKSNNKSICLYDQEAIRARAQNSPLSEQVAIYRRAYPQASNGSIALTSSWTSGGVTVYTPVFNPFCEGDKSNLDLSFYEQMQLYCTLNSKVNARLVDAITSMTCTLWTWTYLPEADYLKSLQSKNQIPSAPLTFLGYSTMTERTTLTGATTSTVFINSNAPITHLSFFIRNLTDGTVANTVINSYSIKIAGSTWLDNVPWLVGSYEAECAGSSKIVPTSATALGRVSDDEYIVDIPMGLKPYDRTFNSGAMSFNQLNRPSITVNHASITPANWELCVCYEYLTLINLDASNGTVEVRASQ